MLQIQAVIVIPMEQWMVEKIVTTSKNTPT